MSTPRTQRERLAMLLAGGALGGAGIVPRAAPLPKFQIPGMAGAGQTPGMPPFTAQAPALPPTTVAATAPPPPAPPQQPPPQMPSQDAPPPMPPSLAIQAAPGMSQMPQTDTQLADWRKLMDAMQYARQGQ